MQGFALTVLEIFLSMLVILGFIYEEKLANAEEKLFFAVKKLIKRRRRRAAKTYLKRTRIADKYCA